MILCHTIFNINKSFWWLRRSQDLFDPLGALEVTREAEQFGASWWMCLIQGRYPVFFWGGSITMDMNFQYGSIWICTCDWYQGFDVSCYFCSVDSDNRYCACRNDYHIYFQQLVQHIVAFQCLDVIYIYIVIQFIWFWCFNLQHCMPTDSCTVSLKHLKNILFVTSPKQFERSRRLRRILCGCV